MTMPIDEKQIALRLFLAFLVGAAIGLHRRWPDFQRRKQSSGTDYGSQCLADRRSGHRTRSGDVCYSYCCNRTGIYRPAIEHEAAGKRRIRMK